MTASIFTDQNIAHIIELFLWMTGSFVIGWFFGRKLNTSRNHIDLRKKHEFEQLLDQDDHISNRTPTIRATKTFERGGAMVIPVMDTPEEPISETLEFNRIGKGLPDNPDDLKKIKGIGPVIEGKLQNIGFYNYKQLSNLTSEDVEKLGNVMSYSSDKIKLNQWVSQARKLQEACKE